MSALKLNDYECLWMLFSFVLVPLDDNEKSWRASDNTKLFVCFGFLGSLDKL